MKYFFHITIYYRLLRPKSVIQRGGLQILDVAVPFVGYMFVMAGDLKDFSVAFR